MISIQEASRLIRQHSKSLSSTEVLVHNSFGLVLARDVRSPVNLPSFRQSAMDGFALRKADLDQGMREFQIKGEVPAGPYKKINVNSGQAVQIFTGAVVPDDCDTIIIQEVCRVEGNRLVVETYKKGQKTNIRAVGEQVKKGELALEKGHLINPASVGFLASMGLEKLRVVRKPGIALISTGNELRPAGSRLRAGEIHESNSSTLSTALRQHRFFLGEDRQVKDDLEDSISQVAAALEHNDVLIISGGISVGKYDFVREALKKNGVKEVFYKVNQKPGKPLFFGVKGKKLVFALPGNPASLLTCYYIHVLPALQVLSGMEAKAVRLMARLRSSYRHQGPRPVFLKGLLSGDSVKVLEGQASFVMRSFAQANVLVYIHGENRTLTRGEEVEVIPIDTL